jgi:hypothetical protein
VEQDQRGIGFIHSRPGLEYPPWLEPRAQLRPFSGDDIDIHQVAVLGDNTRYLRELVSEVGWIDGGRFGYPTSNSAFLLVQHSYDLPLMMAVLPKLWADVQADKVEGGMYGLLYDRLQLALGEKQRFGSQVFTDSAGELVLFPVEDPSRLDDLRASLRMEPVSDYVKAFGATEVRFSSACSSLTSSRPR